MTQTTVKDVIRVLEDFAPPELAFEGDRIGLHVGSMNAKVNKVMIALDVLEEVVDEAIKKNVNLIIAHHPLIFKPLKSIDLNSDKGRIIQKLLQHQISVYAAHTNLDITSGGVNDMLMNQLGIELTDVLVETGEEKLYKLVVFTPETHENELRDALSEAGAGHIGDYSHCTFMTPGTGTFKPLIGTNPYIGSQGELERVSEVRMETIAPEHLLKRVIHAAEEAHPYEEMAYDVYPENITGSKHGLGRIGELENKITLKELCQHVKQSFNVPFVRAVGDPNKKVKKVAIIGGDGNKFINQAKIKGADVLITGDVYYHTAHDALGIGLPMIDPGHHIEKVMKTELAKILQEKTTSLDVDIVSSETVTEPFQVF
ncbi:Nif3-like dinuclear metal center hexameric protein [Tenuibacillus multivorans]|uniref:GTP cyclohydrolase 1 type 2 homolog n=1 Tax=Tenuibacillus multivorans TaxID=237069 RepID=A0A1G9ZD53_9BACI|nr:Nif3-like dinuclear metal center hexameric protein [Tenuibacillus multivorans]GEL78301.1 GTP cyclohydrolase 1 type 2 [Tenuibacillus multivorans]SDN18871.1 dinuclear metal center protein, YbgI/SA1388 family [Tenuibacillus multivorans]